MSHQDNTTLSPSGHEKVIEIVGLGHSFSEAVVLPDMPNILSVQSVTDTMLLKAQGLIFY